MLSQLNVQMPLVQNPLANAGLNLGSDLQQAFQSPPADPGSFGAGYTILYSAAQNNNQPNGQGDLFLVRYQKTWTPSGLSFQARGSAGSSGSLSGLTLHQLGQRQP